MKPDYKILLELNKKDEGWKWYHVALLTIAGTAASTTWILLYIGVAP